MTVTSINKILLNFNNFFIENFCTIQNVMQNITLKKKRAKCKQNKKIIVFCITNIWFKIKYTTFLTSMATL